MKIYISGPITGVKDYMYKFNEVELALQEAGHEVVNPARVNANLPEGTSYEEYMRMSITMLDMCEAIFILEGWEESTGCNKELGHALRNGHTVIFEGGKGWLASQNKQKQENSAMQ